MEHRVRSVPTPDTRIEPAPVQDLFAPTDAERIRDMLRALMEKIESLEHDMNMDRMFMEALARRDSIIAELA
jgi:hypothetical protein